MKKQLVLTSTGSRALKKCECQLGWWGQDCTEYSPGTLVLNAGWAIYRNMHPPTPPLPLLPPLQLASATPSSRSTTTQPPCAMQSCRQMEGDFPDFEAMCSTTMEILTALQPTQPSNLIFSMRCYLTRGYKLSRWDREYKKAKCAVHTYKCCCHLELP